MNENYHPHIRRAFSALVLEIEKEKGRKMTVGETATLVSQMVGLANDFRVETGVYPKR